MLNTEQYPKVFTYQYVNFLDIKKFNHDFENINQFSANKIKYKDYILNASFHTIKTGKIKSNKIEVTKYLPYNIIKKYSNLDILQ